MRRNVKIRVIGVLKKWIADHYDDFRNSDKLMKGLEEFLGNVEIDNPMHAKSLLTTIGNKVNSIFFFDSIYLQGKNV